MSKGNKTICTWDKDDIKDDLEKLKGIVNPLHFICRTCGQVAKESDSLRKAVEL